MATGTSVRWSRGEVYALVALVALALGFRGYSLGGLGGLWLDEIWAVMHAAGNGNGVFTLPDGKVMDGTAVWGSEGVTVRGSVATVWAGLASEIHPPLFYVLLRGWMAVVGTGEAALRAFSVLFSVASVPVVYVVARQTVGRRAAVAGVVLLAVAFGPVYYAQECRSYMLLQFISVGLVWTCVRVREAGATWGRLVMLGGLLLAGGLTHYYFFGGAAGLVIWLLVSGRREDRGRVALAVAIAAVVYAVAWGPWMVRQKDFWGFGSHMEDRQFTTGRAVARAVAAPARVLLPPASVTSPMTLAVGAGVLALAVLSLVRRRDDAGVWGAYLLGGLSLLIAADLARDARSLDFPRYVVHLSPAVCVLIAGGVLRRGEGEAGAWTLIPVGVAVAAMLYLTPGYAYQDKGGWKGLAGWMTPRVGPGDAVVLHSDGPRDWTPFARYFCFTYYAPSLRDRPVVFWRGAESLPETVARELTARGGRVWVFSGRPVTAEAPTLAPGWRQVEVMGVTMPDSSETPRSLRVMEMGVR